MPTRKLSVTMEASLAKLVRAAASKEGVSLSTWLADAARAKVRQHGLRAALAEYAKVHGAPSPDEAARIVAATRTRSIVTYPRRRGTRSKSRT